MVRYGFIVTDASLKLLEMQQSNSPMRLSSTKTLKSVLRRSSKTREKRELPHFSLPALDVKCLLFFELVGLDKFCSYNGLFCLPAVLVKMAYSAQNSSRNPKKVLYLFSQI